MKLLFVLFYGFLASYALNIVIHSGFGGRSHIKSILDYSKLLIERGHNITYAALDENKKYIKEHDQIQFYSLGDYIMNEEQVYNMSYETVLKEGIDLDPMDGIVKRFTPILTNSFDKIYHSLKQYLIETHPDLLICDFFSIPCTILAKQLSIPLAIGIQSSDVGEFVDAPYLVKDLNYGELTMKNMNYFDRFYHLIIYPIKTIGRVLPLINTIKTVENKYNVKIGTKLFGDLNYPIILANTFTGFEVAIPLQPNLFQIGPILNEPKDVKVSDELNGYLNQHTNILYIGFGSFSALNNKLIRNVLLSVTHAIEQGIIDSVIWGLGKTRISEFPKEVQLNNKTIPISDFFTYKYSIVLLEWAPQIPILQHNNTKIFLSHTGMESILEALSSNTKVLGLPLFGDQFRNARKIVDNELGLYLPKTFNVKQFIDKINQLQKYQNKFNSASDRFNIMVHFYSKRLSYAADLLESHAYLAKSCRLLNSYDPAIHFSPCEIQHLIPASHEMGFIKSYGLDIFLPIFLVFVFLIYMCLGWLLKLTYQRMTYKLKKE